MTNIFGGHTQLNVPMTFQTINQAFIYVEPEEWNHLTGNEKESFFKDCFSWKEASRLVGHCDNICLPVNMQYIWEENVDRPRCQNGSDHDCMMKTCFDVV